MKKQIVRWAAAAALVGASLGLYAQEADAKCQFWNNEKAAFCIPHCGGPASIYYVTCYPVCMCQSWGVPGW